MSSGTALLTRNTLENMALTAMKYGNFNGINTVTMDTTGLSAVRNLADQMTNVDYIENQSHRSNIPIDGL